MTLFAPRMSDLKPCSICGVKKEKLVSSSVEVQWHTGNIIMHYGVCPPCNQALWERNDAYYKVIQPLQLQTELVSQLRAEHAREMKEMKGA